MNDVLGWDVPKVLHFVRRSALGKAIAYAPRSTELMSSGIRRAEEPLREPVLLPHLDYQRFGDKVGKFLTRPPSRVYAENSRVVRTGTAASVSPTNV